MIKNVVFISILIFLPLSIYSEDIRIAVLTPTTENNTYWPQVYNLLNAAADDLGLEIVPFEFDVSDRYAKTVEGVKVLQSKPVFDGAILSVAFGQALPLLDVAEQLCIPVFVQGPISLSERIKAGYNPGDKYKCWLGYFMQDEQEKGYLLGKLLIDQAAESGAYDEQGYIQIFGISGDYSWDGTEKRELGLLQAVEEDSSAILHQVVPTLWTPIESEAKTASLLERYPKTSVVWAASDQIAIGVAQALNASGRRTGKDVFTGGLDLSMAGLEKIEEGSLTATVSGLLFFYTKILVLLHDHLRGIDITNETDADIYPEIYSATQENINVFLKLYRDYEKIDFKTLSKVYNRNLNFYDFSLDKLIESMNED